MSAEARLEQLGLVLPQVPSPVANYVPFRLAGNLLFLSGQGPRDDKGNALTGKVGAEVSVEEAYRRARTIGLQLLSTARLALGSLDRVEAVLKVLGMVNAVPEFKDHPKVINGCSDLLVEVLGEAGRHARSAVGMGSLPNQISVEIEAILAIRN
jgi:enamine deaminase RidA (YjgF/YER057c/UK114 family)